MNGLPGYDTWKAGPYGRFERDQERRGEAYSLALSERDSDYRQDPVLLSEAFADAIDDPAVMARWQHILQAAACHENARHIGDALTRLVNDIISAEAERLAEEETR